MSPRPTRRPARRRVAVAAAALAAVASITPLGLRPDAAAAAPVATTDATFAWTLSEHAWTSTSLAYTSGPIPTPPASEMVAPAVRGTDGFEFTADEATFDPATGAAEAAFDGSFALGNTNQGGYRVRFASPTVTVDADGSGEIVADVGYCTSAAACSTTGYTVVDDVVVATFSTSSRSVDGTTVTISATPDFVPQPDDAAVGSPTFEGAREVSHELTAALPSSLRGHFRETAADQTTKAPAPFTLSFTYEAGPGPAPLVQVSPTSGLDPDAATTTLTISGTGFTKADDDPSPAGLGVYVRWCIATDGRPTSSQCLASPQHWVGPTVPPSTALLGADGTFSVTLDVPPTFTAGDTTYDCTEVQCGIHIRRDHNGGGADLAYDSFVPVSYAEPTVPTTPTQPTTPTTTPPEPEPGVGTLDWGVKLSFRNYVLHGPAQGAVTLGPPATANADGTYRFDAGSPVTYDGPDDVVAQFEGSVRFTGHHGALDLTLADPRVEIDGDAGVVLLDGSSRDLDSGVVTELDDVPVAALDLSAVEPTAVGDVVTFADVPATLTEEGEFAFEGFYAAGDPLDAVTFSIEVDDPGSLPPPTEPVAGCVPDTVVAGQPVTVCGEGFLPGEQVQVFLHSDPVFLDVTTADADGTVSATVVIPADTAPGRHRIELRGVTSGKQLFSVELTVIAAPDDVLPRTGSDTTSPAVAGLLLAAAGSALVRRSRRALARS